MTKASQKVKARRLQASSEKPASQSATVTLSDLREDLDLWYRIHVLLHDLNNVKDSPSEKRLSMTMNELYISEPYFRDFEATKIRTALINDLDEPGFLDGIDTDGQEITVERALHYKLANFLDKRKASGDARPCGPHDMVPIYSSIFRITKEDLGDERFLGRLRRSGLGDSSVKKAAVEAAVEAAADGPRMDSSRQSRKKGKKGSTNE